MPATIIFNQINVNSVKNNSTVATGQNSQIDWSTQGKSILGLGSAAGVIFTANNLNVINDQDVMDTYVNENELNNPQPTFTI